MFIQVSVHSGSCSHNKLKSSETIYNISPSFLYTVCNRSEKTNTVLAAVKRI